MANNVSETVYEHKLAWAVVIFVIGLSSLAVATRENADATKDWKEVSKIIGWLYFIAWSISFYPQLILNYKRRSTEGLSYNFVWLNLVGFVCYSIFNCAFYFSDELKESYRRAFDKTTTLVHFNDVCFAVHAATITALTLYQMYCMNYAQSPGILVSYSVRAFVGGAVVVCAAYLAIIFAKGNPEWTKGESNIFTVFTWVYFVSYIKLGISFVKYLPQVHLNYKLKSTEGWSLHNVLLDFTGGFLSFLQMFIDVYFGGAEFNEDPVKLGLSVLSIVFDIIFMVQHYILYAPSKRSLYEPLSHLSEEDTSNDDEQAVLIIQSSNASASNSSTAVARANKTQSSS